MPDGPFLLFCLVLGSVWETAGLCACLPAPKSRDRKHFYGTEEPLMMLQHWPGSETRLRLECGDNRVLGWLVAFSTVSSVIF